MKMIERLARFACEWAERDPDTSLGGDGQNFLWMEVADTLIKPLLLELREPDEGMVEYIKDRTVVGCCGPNDTEVREACQAMIDSILEDE